MGRVAVVDSNRSRAVRFVRAVLGGVEVAFYGIVGFPGTSVSGATARGIHA
jgi:hypothetical protein